MTQNSPKPIQHTPPSAEEDYSIIEQALLQNPRGKWFLEEYIKRNRPEDTKKLLSAIERIENNLDQRNNKPETDLDPIRMSILEMANAIAKTREEIKSIKPANETDNQLTSATEELGAIVTSTEDATNTILEAAEEIQESAWLLREAGAEAAPCDRIDSKTTEIYTACSFQDITGQRTNKVVQALAYIENRVNAMIEIWGLGDPAQQTPIRDDRQDTRPDAHLLNGPAKLGEELQQNSVDEMMLHDEAEAEVKDTGLGDADLGGQDFADTLSFDQINPAEETGLDGDIEFETSSSKEPGGEAEAAIDLASLTGETADMTDQNAVEMDLAGWPGGEQANEGEANEISALNPGLADIETPPAAAHQPPETGDDEIDSLDLEDLIVTETPLQTQPDESDAEEAARPEEDISETRSAHPAPQAEADMKAETEMRAETEQAGDMKESEESSKVNEIDLNCLSFDDLENLEELAPETLSDDQKDTLLG